VVLAHISDVHFGRIADPRIVGALIDDVHAADVAVAVVGGDLTQRSRPSEWEAAKAFLALLPGEVIVIAGNHDVYPWWFPIRRVLTPLVRYRMAVNSPLDVTLRLQDVRLIGLNSAHGLTDYGGKFNVAQAELAEEFLGSGDITHYRILLVHHQIVRSEYTRRGDVAKRSERVLAAAVNAGVDVVLDGHIHRSGVGLLCTGGRTVVRSSAGTATSDRGRFRDRGRNLYSLVRLDSGVEVEERVFDRDSGHFRCERLSAFRRMDGGWCIDTGAEPGVSSN